MRRPWNKFTSHNARRTIDDALTFVKWQVQRQTEPVSTYDNRFDER